MKKAHNYLSAYDRLAWAVAELARDQTSHLYDEDVSAEIAARICGEYLVPLGALAALYRARRGQLTRPR